MLSGFRPLHSCCYSKVQRYKCVLRKDVDGGCWIILECIELYDHQKSCLVLTVIM